MEAWCSGLTCGPVKAETAGSNPVASAPETGTPIVRVPVFCRSLACCPLVL